MAKIAAVLLVLLALPGLAGGEEQKRAGYKAQVDSFFNLLQHGKPAEALESFFQSNPRFAAENKISLQQTKAQFASFVELVGDYRDHDLLAETVVADRYAHLVFFVAYDRQPLLVELQFYRPEDVWVSQNFSFAGDVGDEIEEITKLKLWQVLVDEHEEARPPRKRATTSEREPTSRRP